MTLSSSLSTSVSGLKAQATAISGVSSNLANSSTKAYKTGITSFEDLVTQTSTSSGGVSAATNYYNNNQGTIESADQATYLAISGSGYFAVKSGVLNTDGTVSLSDSVYYTRCGDFSVNNEGYLVNDEGYYLMAWSVEPDSGNVTKTLTPVQITDLTESAVATTEINYAANLPSSAAVGTTTASSTVTIYDSLGNEHAVSYYWTKTDVNTWDLTVSAPGGAYDSSSGTAGDYSATISFTFNTDGTVQSIDDTGSGYSVTGNTVSYDLNYEGASTQTVSTDFTDMSQYADTAISVTSLSQNGVSAGSFQDITITTEGYVTINYTNGVSKIYYQIPIATFSAENSLTKISGNAYTISLSSGSPTYSAAGSGGAGSITSNALEDSTVDIATEFTTMIQAQQVYSANAKAITTVDTMMQTLIQLAQG